MHPSMSRHTARPGPIPNSIRCPALGTILGITLALASCSSDPTSKPFSEPGPHLSGSTGATRMEPGSANGRAGDLADGSVSSGTTAVSIVSPAAGSLSGDFAAHPALRDFIQYMVSAHGFSESDLNRLFSKAQRLPFVIRLETEPLTAPPQPGSWSRYRSIFLTGQRISDGVRFWAAHAGTLERAHREYGVDPEYIVAIIGVETFYGRNTGRTPVLDALTTLTMESPRRAKFFMSELENFVLMTREEGLDPHSLEGSWAGAMGLGQFMPSSFRRLAVDFDSDGRRDLWSPEDAIGSVANYFAQNGWEPSHRVAERATRVSPASYKQGDIVALSTYGGDEYWRVYPNFRVIKTYNNSDKYAMAVHQLAQAIKSRYLGPGLRVQR
jgi:membrane-bound lytic murein transglycosylase B